MSAIGIDIHIFRQNLSPEAEDIFESFSRDSRSIADGTVVQYQSIKQLLENSIAKEKMVQTGQMSQSNVCCILQLLYTEELLVLNLDMYDWNERVSHFVERNKGFCTHDRKLVLLLNFFTIVPISPLRTVNEFSVFICVKQPHFNSNDNQLAEPKINRFLLMYRRSEPLVGALEEFMKIAEDDLNVDINSIEKKKYEVFTVKSYGVVPVGSRECKLGISQFVKYRMTNLPDPSSLIILVHAFYIRKVNQVSNGKPLPPR